MRSTDAIFGSAVQLEEESNDKSLRVLFCRPYIDNINTSDSSDFTTTRSQHVAKNVSNSKLVKLFLLMQSDDCSDDMFDYPQPLKITETINRFLDETE